MPKWFVYGLLTSISFYILVQGPQWGIGFYVECLITTVFYVVFLLEIAPKIGHLLLELFSISIDNESIAMILFLATPFLFFIILYIIQEI